uniref:Uncharacterized protein n=1 Tax=Glossina palpalis gambiensis TaxID=67801 RepID=A0A1B0B4P8_9MUSC
MDIIGEKNEGNIAQSFETTSYNYLDSVSLRIIEEIDKWTQKDKKEQGSTSLTVNEKENIEKNGNLRAWKRQTTGEEEAESYRQSAPLAKRGRKAFDYNHENSNQNVATFRTTVLQELNDPDDDTVSSTRSKEKMEKAMLRVNWALDCFKMYSVPSQKLLEGGFVFASTMRKLSHGCFSGAYKYRSPLHKINNVHYKFSSRRAVFNMREWGLEALSSKIATNCRILGFDADCLHDKLDNLDLPPNLQQLIDESSDRVLANTVSFFKDVATQTDGNGNFNMIEEIDSYDVAADPIQENRLNDPPLVFATRNFNSNQMTAMLYFADLLRESCPQEYSDLYNVQQRMLAIYKSSLSTEVSWTNASSYPRHNLTNEFTNRGSLNLTPTRFSSSPSIQIRILAAGLSTLTVREIVDPIFASCTSPSGTRTSPLLYKLINPPFFCLVYKPGKVLYKEKTPVLLIAKNRNQARMNINNYKSLKE